MRCVCVCVWGSTRVVGSHLSDFDAAVLGGAGLSARVACRRRATRQGARRSGANCADLQAAEPTRLATARQVRKRITIWVQLHPRHGVARRRHATRALSPAPPNTTASKAESCNPTTRVERHTHTHTQRIHNASRAHMHTNRNSAHIHTFIPTPLQVRWQWPRPRHCRWEPHFGLRAPSQKTAQADAAKTSAYLKHTPANMLMVLVVTLLH